MNSQKLMNSEIIEKQLSQSNSQTGESKGSKTHDETEDHIMPGDLSGA